jgi:hypothetical protein
MAPETKRIAIIAIAEACRWKDVEFGVGCNKDLCLGDKPEFYRGKIISYTVDREVPDYPNDLNAMHSAVKSQTPKFRAEFQERLDNMALTRRCLVCELTADDWAHCFLAISLPHVEMV